MSEPIKILVIDDSKDDWELYRRALRKTDNAVYTIYEACDGTEGFDKIVKHLPDCILLDYSLPGRDGIEVLKQIRSKYPYLAVLIMTGQGNENIAASAIKEGAQDYMSKSSITPDNLQRVIRLAIEYCALQKDNQEQQASLEIFSRALAHDLKEPVNTIGSFLDLLIMHEKLTERGQTYLQYCKGASERMSALIDTVYFYTRLSDKQEIVRTMCDATQIVSDTKDNLVSLIQDRKAVITSDALPQVYANRVQLMQVLQNLIANAVHYCESQPIIHVGVTEEENQWKFSVTDNGPGIDKELRDKIFEPFKRLARNKGKGMGLGLAICKKIIDGHGGAIWYEFGATGGTAFLFTLPKPTGRSENVQADTPVRQAATISEARPLANILLVEDNESDVALTRLMLIEEGGLRCNLLVASDAFEALTMMHAEIEKSGFIDLILLDINMPGMDGFELMKRMHEDKKLKHVPIILCTTSNYGKDMEMAKFLGANGYITKPAELKKLKPAIDNISSLHLHPDNGGYTLLRA